MKEKKPYRNDLHGLKFNKLSVVGFSHICKNNGAVWDCICECGGSAKVSTSRLSKGHTKTCGCLQRQRTAEASTKHGMHDTPIYIRWSAMKARCNNPNSAPYGAKGITYVEEWENFENFHRDMAEGFSEDLELDRIDVTKGYSKGNCRWITHNENNYNKNMQSNNTSGKTGVSELGGGGYRAYITVNRKQINLGTFADFESAIAARKKAELELYGYERP